VGTSQALADVDAQANVSLSSVYLTHYINDAFASVNITLVSDTLSLYNNILDTTAVKFPYEDYADQYDRRQTVVLVGPPTNDTVVVVDHQTNDTVVVVGPPTNATVFIAA
jgi:hypothetical protein